MSEEFKVVRLRQSVYDALANRESNCLYFTEDTCRIYKGNDCYTRTSAPGFDPVGGSVGQVLARTENGFAWRWVSELPSPLALVLHVPLTSESATAVTGQNITATGTPQYEFDTELNRNVLVLDGSSFLTLGVAGLPAGARARTLSCWAKSNAAVSENKCIFSYGTSGENKTFGISLMPENTLGVVGGGGEAYQNRTEPGAVRQTAWNHFCITNDGLMEKIYVNGTLSAFSVMERSTGGAYARIGAWISGSSSNNFQGRIAELRLFDGVLTIDEISSLSNQGGL